MTRSSSLRSRAANAVVLAALVLPLLLVTGMFAHARRTERARAETVKGALRDYAMVAAWQLSNRLGEAFHQTAMAQLRSAGIGMGEGGGGGAGMMQGRGHTPCTTCNHPVPTVPVFDVDVASGNVTWTGPSVARVPDASLVAAIRSEAVRPVEEPHRLFFTSDSSNAIVALFPSGSRTAARGVVVSDSLFRRAVDGVLRTAEILPRSLVAPPFGPDRLHVRVARAGGSLLFESGAKADSSLAASESIDSTWGNLDVTVELMPTLQSALLLGSTPRSVTSAFLLLLGVSLLLALAAFWQIRRARALDLMRTRFVANVSHELRTPLAHISMFAETIMLERERSTTERRYFASVIHREAGRLSILVDGVLRFARGEGAVKHLPTEVRDVAADVADAVGAFTSASSGEAEIVVARDDEAVAYADPDALRQITLNLLDNAVKYGPRTQTIHVTVARRESAVVLTVADQGPGIPERDRLRVLEPYERLERDNKVSGTGIGLAVVRDLVAAQGGRLWIDASPKGGAAVSVALKAAP